MSNLYVISSTPLTPEALATLMARLRAACERPPVCTITCDDPNTDPSELARLLTGDANLIYEADNGE